ncbi:MAG: EamA family transporter, partial [Thermoguttaceae bacterium]|nr:EamA family transporter [Thermoguttaceae bacterium]
TSSAYRAKAWYSHSNLATAIRTGVVLILACVVVWRIDAWRGVAELGAKNWTFLILSGLATGASWLFYYKALQMGTVAKIVAVDKTSAAIALVMAFVFLGEHCDVKTAIGAVLLTLGALITVP